MFPFAFPSPRLGVLAGCQPNMLGEFPLQGGRVLENPRCIFPRGPIIKFFLAANRWENQG